MNIIIYHHETVLSILSQFPTFEPIQFRTAYKLCPDFSSIYAFQTKIFVREDSWGWMPLSFLFLLRTESLQVPRISKGYNIKARVTRTLVACSLNKEEKLFINFHIQVCRPLMPWSLILKMEQTIIYTPWYWRNIDLKVSPWAWIWKRQSFIHLDIQGTVMWSSTPGIKDGRNNHL